MPDWNQLVRQRLAGIDLDEEELTEVVEELADHLEEGCRNFISRGATEQEAILMSLQEVSSWRDLCGEIEFFKKKEPPMNKRVSQFWFPAFLTLLLSQVALMLIQTLGPRMYVSPAASHPRLLPPNTVFVAWLATLPFIGALGAYLSARAGGRAKSVFSAITFPVFPFLAFVVIGLPIAMAFDDRVAKNLTIPLFLVSFSAWVVFPALALALGGWSLRYLVQWSDRIRATAS